MTRLLAAAFKYTTDPRFARPVDDWWGVMTVYVKAWQCIGCGKIEAPPTCIGVCQDRKVQFVYASEHEEVLADARHAQQRADVLEALVRQLAYTTPRKGEWERSYLVLQNQAQRAVVALAQRSVSTQ